MGGCEGAKGALVPHASESIRIRIAVSALGVTKLRQVPKDMPLAEVVRDLNR